jgi:hypothetical protein
MGEAKDAPQGDLRRSGNNRALLLPILAVIIASTLIVFAGHEWGVSHDCAASEITQDGQCGLATGMGDLFGFVAGGLFCIAGITMVVVGWQKRRSELPKR